MRISSAALQGTVRGIETVWPPKTGTIWGLPVVAGLMRRAMWGYPHVCSCCHLGCT